MLIGKNPDINFLRPYSRKGTRPLPASRRKKLGP